MDKFSSRLKLMMQVKRLGMRSLDLRRPEMLQANLTFVYHMIRASEHLLAVGITQARDPRLVDFYTRHLEEESSHAEWLRRDMEAAGLTFSSIPREAMLMAGVQYYLLFHVSPASLLGYMAALECFPTSMEQLGELEAVHGEPVMRCMRYHAEHDVQHGAELLAFIDTRPYPEQGAIMESAEQACHFMSLALSHMEANCG